MLIKLDCHRVAFNNLFQFLFVGSVCFRLESVVKNILNRLRGHIKKIGKIQHRADTTNCCLRFWWLLVYFMKTCLKYSTDCFVHIGINLFHYWCWSERPFLKFCCNAVWLHQKKCMKSKRIRGAAASILHQQICVCCVNTGNIHTTAVH